MITRDDTPRVVAEPLPQQSDAAASDLAVAESRAIALGKLDEDARRKEHTRRETFRDVIHWTALVLVVGFAAYVGLTGLAVGLHSLLPASWHWLTPDQLLANRSFLTTAITSGAAVELGRRQLSKL